MGGLYGRRRKPVLGVDDVIAGDRHAQFTRDYLLQRGSCCEHNCRFCPFPCRAQSDSVLGVQLVPQTVSRWARSAGEPGRRGIRQAGHPEMQPGDVWHHDAPRITVCASALIRTERSFYFCANVDAACLKHIQFGQANDG